MLRRSREMVRLYKEQFGRGPTHARSDFAGRDTLVCTLENALLPAERAMVEAGATDRVRGAICGEEDRRTARTWGRPRTPCR